MEPSFQSECTQTETCCIGARPVAYAHTDSTHLPRSFLISTLDGSGQFHVPAALLLADESPITIEK
jgi:hypothetical protein